MALFAFEDVSVLTDRGPILDRVDLEVPDGGITVVVGPSGAGKSTLLRLCNRLEVPTSGVVRFRGEEVAGRDPVGLRRRVGMVFQRPTLFGGTVRDNLRVADPDAGEERLAEALGSAELPAGMVDRVADELSGGEAQRVCLARTLLTEPEVLLADEPTSALDREPRLALERLVRRLADRGVPTVWVTHQLDQMRRLADHVVVLIEGRVRYTGDVAGLDAPGDEQVARLVAEVSDGEVPDGGVPDGGVSDGR